MEKKEIKIKATNEDLKGVPSNLMIVRHTKEEFCLDFINNFNPPILTARILVTPSHLKRMIEALKENMKKYEQKFGQIEPAKELETRIGFKPQ